MREFEATQASRWRDIRNDIYSEGVKLRKQYPKLSDAPPEILERLKRLKCRYTEAVAKMELYEGIALWDEEGDE